MTVAITEILPRPAVEPRRSGPSAFDATPSGLIEGYASLFDVVDMAKDLVEAGAFRDSLVRRGAGGVRLLWQHDAKEPIGAWLSLREDARGLFARGRLNLGSARGRDAFALVRQGAVDGLSIGFKPERARSETRGGVRRLSRVDLWEISIVTFPMLTGARVVAVASEASTFDGEPGALAHRIRRAATLFHAARSTA